MFETSDVPSQLLAEIESGEGLGLAAAGQLFPGSRGGRAISPSTVFRWVTRGSKMTNGQLLRLDAVRVGSRWLTSRGAVDRFVQTLTVSAQPAENTAVPAASSQDQLNRNSSELAIA